MSDWTFLNKHRVREPSRTVPDKYVSSDEDGFNGMFRLPKGGHIVRCVASDGTGDNDPKWKWQHVSVSLEMETKPPTWPIMCWIKDLFWEPDDVCVQYHPAKKDYVNFHPYCLHIWRPLLLELPTPLPIMVGPKITT